MRTLQESILNINESKYVTFDEDSLNNMNNEELWDALEQAAAAKAVCYIRKNKKGEAELTELIKNIRAKLK